MGSPFQRFIPVKTSQSRDISGMHSAGLGVAGIDDDDDDAPGLQVARVSAFH